MLRAGPFSDERVMRLANRRFVSFYFDLADSGFAGDADARKFVVAKRKELGGSGVATPPVLFMTPDGEIAAEVNNYASPDKVLATMLKVLKDHADRARPAEGEREDDPDVAFDLQDFERAQTLYEKAGNAYGTGRAARWRGDWEGMEKAFAKVADKDLADDVSVERAYRHWHAREFEKLRDALAGIPRESNRWTEARYYLGLAHHHLGEKEKALEVWKETIAGCGQDPWIYRADWAWFDVKFGKRQAYTTGDKKRSCLGRIGYMGGRNPDLK